MRGARSPIARLGPICFLRRGCLDTKGLRLCPPCNPVLVALAADRGAVILLLQTSMVLVVLGGFSQGGAVALTAGLRCASKNVAAVVGTSTWLPLGDSYPSKLADGALKRRVSLHHGDADEVVRTSWGVASKERPVEHECRVSCDTYAGTAHRACPEGGDACPSFLRRI